MYNQTKADHLDIMRHVSKALKKEGYDRRGKVYPALGNHEGLPCDAFDADNKTHEWILSETYNEWEQWLNKEGKQACNS